MFLLPTIIFFAEKKINYCTQESILPTFFGQLFAINASFWRFNFRFNFFGARKLAQKLNVGEIDSSSKRCSEENIYSKPQYMQSLYLQFCVSENENQP
jgi:hypothetical protein